MSAKKNLLVDASIFAAFLVAFEPRLTGNVIHEWLSLALAATIIVHLVLHWEWVITVGGQFLRKLFHASRLNFILDAVLFVAFIMLMLSGILISKSVLSTLGIQLAAGPTWKMIHSTAADVCMLLTALHFALHWKWIVSTVKRYVILPLGKVVFPRKLQPAQVVLPVKES